MAFLLLAHIPALFSDGDQRGQHRWVGMALCPPAENYYVTTRRGLGEGG